MLPQGGRGSDQALRKLISKYRLMNSFTFRRISHLRIIRFCITILILSSASGCVNDDQPGGNIETGDPIPSFTIELLSGETFCSEDYYGSGSLLIVFFNTECEDCRRELPLIEKIFSETANSAQSSELNIICISREENRESVERYWKEHQLTLPVSPQPDRKIYEMFASIGIPRFYLCRNGIIDQSGTSISSLRLP